MMKLWKVNETLWKRFFPHFPSKESNQKNLSRLLKTLRENQKVTFNSLVCWLTIHVCESGKLMMGRKIMMQPSNMLLVLEHNYRGQQSSCMHLLSIY